MWLLVRTVAPPSTPTPLASVHLATECAIAFAAHWAKVLDGVVAAVGEWGDVVGCVCRLVASCTGLPDEGFAVAFVFG